MMERSNIKALICDDSMLVRKKLRVLLEDEFSCLVIEAANGREAIAQYQKEHPQIVFMDIVMPECDGLEALKKIKAIDNEAKVIMVSSTGTSTKLIDALKLGAADFIQKPYDQGQIAKAIATVRS
jgi:two-component system chemotaxis response regulator CheY